MTAPKTLSEDVPKIVIVPKEYGSVWLPILCFLIGGLNFALIANVTFHVLEKNEIHQTKSEKYFFTDN